MFYSQVGWGRGELKELIFGLGMAKAGFQTGALRLLRRACCPALSPRDTQRQEAMKISQPKPSEAARLETLLTITDQHGKYLVCPPSANL